MKKILTYLTRSATAFLVKLQGKVMMAFVHFVHRVMFAETCVEGTKLLPIFWGLILAKVIGVSQEEIIKKKL